MTDFEIYSLFITGISASFLGVSLILVAKQLRLIIASHNDNHEWNRRIESHKAIHRIGQLDTDSLNHEFGYVNRRKPIPLKEIEKIFQEKPSVQLVLHKLLNIYEEISNGIFLGTYDEKTIKSIQKSPMEREIVRFREYIQQRRDEGSTRAWIAYERLVNEWKHEDLAVLERDKTGKI